jgi:octaprenyl-diphosphate synthase
MSLAHETNAEPNHPEILSRLQSLCGDNALPSLEAKLADLASFVGGDLAPIDEALRLVSGERAAHEGAAHLLSLGGKRLRPICVALAAKLGSGFDERALSVSVAVELVHAATLLHDDVIDMADTRRGKPTARAIWGNSVSIYAGDWLLIEALRRVSAVGVPDLLTTLFDVIDEMIVSESLQLESRGKLDVDRTRWHRVAEGKTAALFRWGMRAGGRVAGLGDDEVAALERYGTHLGIAFQAVDDVLDFGGDPERTGKALFTDLREGKATYPLILAVEREPGSAAMLRALVEASEEDLEGAMGSRHSEVLALLERTRAREDARAFADEHAEMAIAALERWSGGRAIEALTTVARAAVARRA